MKNKFWNKKIIVVEIIISSIFFMIALKYIGLPDKIDYYIYWILTVILIVFILRYLKFVKNELKEILEEKKNEK